MYSEYYCILVAVLVRTLQGDKIFVRLEKKTLRQFDVLDTSKLRDAPDGEAANALYGKMRRAVEVYPWGVVLKDVVRRDTETGEERHVRVTVDETKEYGFCLRHACVDFDWAPDPNAPAHVAWWLLPSAFNASRSLAVAASRSLAVGVAAACH